MNNKMNCKHIRKKLLAYLNDEFEHSTQEQIRLHLDNCEQCRQIREQLSTVQDWMKKSEQVKPDPFFVTRLKQHVKEKSLSKSAKSGARLFIERAMVPVAIVVGLFLGTMAGKNLSLSYSTIEEADYFSESGYFEQDIFNEMPTASLTSSYYYESGLSENQGAENE